MPDPGGVHHLKATGLLVERPDIVTAVLSQRFNFAIHHLSAAHRASCEAYDVERTHQSAGHGPWFEDMMRLVPTAVVMAGAALEANANELIQDFLDQPSGLSKAHKLLLKELKDERSGNAIDKHRRLALVLGNEPDVGKSAWENARLLVKFRSSFLHFRPAWDHEDDIHERGLAGSLRKKVPVARAFNEDFRFPHGLMTYGCAKWAVQSVIAFSKEFSALAKVKDRFAQSPIDFSLP